LLAEVQKAQEKAQLYQLLINYLGELSDGMGGPEAEASFLGREVIQEVILELRDRKELLAEVALSGSEPRRKTPRRRAAKSPPKKPPEGGRKPPPKK